jgi:hypothetical protein
LTDDELDTIKAQAEQVAEENAQRDEWAESDYLASFQHPVHAGYCRYCPHELKTAALEHWPDDVPGYTIPVHCECGCHI